MKMIATQQSKIGAVNRMTLGPSFVGASLLLLVLASCNSSEKKSHGENAGAVPSSTPLHEVTLVAVDNLKIDLSEPTAPQEMGGGVMVLTMEESFTLAVSTSNDPKTLEQAAALAKKNGGSDLKKEVLEDGWALAYTTTKGDKKSYAAWVRRRLAGKDYSCQTSVGFEVLRDGAVRACKSLRK